MENENKELEVKEETVAEETVAEEANDTQAEAPAEEAPKKKGYHLIQPNFKKALTLAIVFVVVAILFGILSCILSIISGVSDNKILKVVISCLFAILYSAQLVFYIIIAIVCLTLTVKKTGPSKSEDIASFIISLVTTIFAALGSIGMCVTVILSLINVIMAIISLFA